MKWDAVVVGGSVAGAATAIELARKGYRVALVEKARFPRPKPCGEGLLPHGVAALVELGLDFPGAPVRGLRYISPGGITATADFPNGRGLVVRRERFDEFMFRAAADSTGVEAFEGTAYDPDRFGARWIVGADGIRSMFHRRPEFRATPPASRRTGLSAHVRGLQIDREFVEVILHCGGEVYLAPSDGNEALVAGLFRKGRLPSGATNEERLMGLLESLPALAGRLGRIVFTTPCLAVAPLGLHVRRVVSEKNRILLVGDAAGAPDPVTGEGMALAILSARAAAEALSSGRPGEYERRRRRLAAGPEWLGRWILRAARVPALADRVVASLADHPELFKRLLEIATGERRPGDISIPELARLVV